MAHFNSRKTRKLKRPQVTTGSIGKRRSSKPSSLVHDILALHYAAGNQAVTHLLQSSQYNESNEQEADRVSDQVIQAARQNLSSTPEITDSSASSSPTYKEPERGKALKSMPVICNDTLNHADGHPLDRSTRSLMEKHLGYDLSQVRVHTDARATASAEALNARAYTLGRDVIFGQGQYMPNTSEGKRLLAHELSHVIQQFKHPQGLLLQRKLKLTGSPANVTSALTILNGGLIGYSVKTDKDGNISLSSTGMEGPPTKEQTALYSRLEKIISDPKQVTVSVAAGSKTLVGSYATGEIDIQDIEKFGSGKGATSLAALIHELEEQFQKQAKGESYGGETSGAHGEGIAAESEVIGATRGPQRTVSASPNPDGTIDAVLEFPWTYPDGTVVTIVMKVSHNNVISVKRR